MNLSTVKCVIPFTHSSVSLKEENANTGPNVRKALCYQGEYCTEQPEHGFKPIDFSLFLYVVRFLLAYGQVNTEECLCLAIGSVL